MSELTREYLDKKLDKLATKEDIKDVKSLVKTEVGRLETKIETEVGKLDTKIENEVANLATMVAKGFADTDRRLDEIKRELDVKDKVDNLDHRMFKIEQALNIKN